MLWIYMASLIVLVGAVADYEIERADAPPVRHERGPDSIDDLTIRAMCHGSDECRTAPLRLLARNLGALFRASDNPIAIA